MIFNPELITHLIEYIDNTVGSVEFACNYTDDENIKSWYIRLRVPNSNRYSNTDISIDYDQNGKITAINKIKIPIDLSIMEEAINRNIQRTYKFKRKEKKLIGS